MAAEALRDFLENGNIRNSVNFPDTLLPRTPGTTRIAVANRNVPNMVGQISTRLARGSINIADLLNKSRGEFAYTLIDTDGNVDAALVADLRQIEGCAVGTDRGRTGSGAEWLAGAAGAAPRRAPRLRWRRFAPRSTRVDELLQELLNRRALLAQQVGISKHADGHTVDFYRPEREAQVLRAALERNAGPLRDEENCPAVPRDHVGLPRPAGAAQGGVPGAGRHPYAGRRL